MEFYLITYLCVIVCILATGRLIYRQLTMPLHLRWELYPVAHETTDRLAYGGSYLEEVNWWEKPQHRSLFNPLRYMVPEILLMAGLWRGNKSLWRTTFPFHFGLYLLIGAFVLMVIRAVVILGGASGGSFRLYLEGITAVIGWSGLVLGTIGGVALLGKRVADQEWRNYSSFSDYFHLLFLLGFFLSALVAALSDPWFTGAQDFVLGLLTAGSLPETHSSPQSLSGRMVTVWASLLIAYLPLSSMSHMFMKYFLYHRVKWDDVPNRRGGKIETAIQNNLEYRPTWQAKHVEADGHKSWKDIVSSVLKEER